MNYDLNMVISVTYEVNPMIAGRMRMLNPLILWAIMQNSNSMNSKLIQLGTENKVVNEYMSRQKLTAIIEASRLWVLNFTNLESSIK